MLRNIAYYTFIAFNKLGLTSALPSIGDKIFMDPGARVTEGIYIGSLATATCSHWLDFHNISAIVNLSNTTYHSNRPVLNISMNDVSVTLDTIEDYSQKFALGVAAIEKARSEGRNVLIHCAAGINRSATQIGFYLIEQGWTYNELIEALELANKTRNTQLLTNESFRFMLKARESYCKTFNNRKAIFSAVASKAPKVVSLSTGSQLQPLQQLQPQQTQQSASAHGTRDPLMC